MNTNNVVHNPIIPLRDKIFSLLAQEIIPYQLVILQATAAPRVLMDLLSIERRDVFGSICLLCLHTDLDNGSITFYYNNAADAASILVVKRDDAKAWREACQRLYLTINPCGEKLVTKSKPRKKYKISSEGRVGGLPLCLRYTVSGQLYEFYCDTLVECETEFCKHREGLLSNRDSFTKSQLEGEWAYVHSVSQSVVSNEAKPNPEWTCKIHYSYDMLLGRTDTTKTLNRFCMLYTVDRVSFESTHDSLEDCHSHFTAHRDGKVSMRSGFVASELTGNITIQKFGNRAIYAEFDYDWDQTGAVSKEVVRKCCLQYQVCGRWFESYHVNVEDCHKAFAMHRDGKVNGRPAFTASELEGNVLIWYDESKMIVRMFDYNWCDLMLGPSGRSDAAKPKQKSRPRKFHMTYVVSGTMYVSSHWSIEECRLRYQEHRLGSMKGREAFIKGQLLNDDVVIRSVGPGCVVARYTYWWKLVVPAKSCD